MLYDLHNPLDAGKFKLRCGKLLQKPCVVELTEKRPRSLAQNSYMHVVIAYFGAVTGNETEYVKTQYFKLHCNPDLFVTEKDDPFRGRIRVLRSTRELTMEQTALAITRFIGWAGREAGVYIPSADDHRAVLQMEIEIERNKQYL